MTCETCARLRKELSALEAMYDLLVKAAKPEKTFWHARKYGLSNKQAQLFDSLAAHTVCSRELLEYTIWGFEERSEKLLDCHIHLLRKKLKPYEISIETTPYGYALTEESKRKLKQELTG